MKPLIVFALGLFVGIAIGLQFVYTQEPTPEQRFEAWRAGLREAEGITGV